MLVSRRSFLSVLASASLGPFVQNAAAASVAAWESLYQSACKRTEVSWINVLRIEDELLDGGVYGLEDRFYIRLIQRTHEGLARRQEQARAQKVADPDLYLLFEKTGHWRKRESSGRYSIDRAVEKRATWREQIAKAGLIECRLEARRLEAEEDEVAAGLSASLYDDPAHARLMSAIIRRTSMPELAVDARGVIENETQSFGYEGDCGLLEKLTLDDFPPAVFLRRLESIGFDFRSYVGMLPHHSLTSAELRQVARLYSCASRVKGMREVFDDFLCERMDGGFLAA